MQTFNLDLSARGVIPLLYAKQRDVGSKILIQLTDNKKEYVIPADVTWSVWFSGKSGEGNYDKIDGRDAVVVEGSNATVELIYQMLDNPGPGEMCLVMNSADGTQLGLWNIPYYVEAIPGADSKAAESYYSAFLDAVRKVEEAAQKVENDMIPDYWKEHLDSKVAQIREAMLTAGINKSAFFFYSDSHWSNENTSTAKMAPTLLKYLCKNTPINKTNFGGDIVKAEGADSDTMAYLWEWRNLLYGLPNHHSVVGNHDDGNATNNLFSENYVYGYLFAPEETCDIVRGEEGMYYYIDNPEEKTRYLYLDTAYQGVTDAQQAFVKAALLSTPENWHIVAIAHLWYYNDYTTYPPVLNGFDTNAKKLLDMFDSYNARSGEYADCGAWVEFCIGGHYHLDHVEHTDGGIPVIIVEADALHDRSGTMPSAGTTDEAAVSAVILDYAAQQIKVIRIGRGADFTVVVGSGEVVTYYSITNALDNVTSSNDTTKVESGTAYTAILTATAGTITKATVTMGGKDITASAYNDGVINIAAVTGNVVITATAEVVQTEDVNYYSVDSHLTNAILFPEITQVKEGEAYEAVLAPTRGTLTQVVVTMGKRDVTESVYDASTGGITIPAVTGNIFIVATAQADIEDDDSNYYSVDIQLTNTALYPEVTQIEKGAMYTASLAALNGTLTSVVVTMGNQDITESVYYASTGRITIPKVTGNISIIAIAQADEEEGYTNVISTSIDSTGAVFNDGKGWAANGRIGSGTLENYIGGGDYYITGHIEIDPTIDNVIRLRNITFKSDTTIDKIGIAFYDANFARVAMQGDNSSSNWLIPSTIANTQNGFDVVYDGTNILQFTFKADSHTTNHSVQYIAICAEYIGDDSIITVNEEIE